ncbi:hypothetical protein T492DRAFT_908807 [Pavlovales sp. CCMP2436]|nr:hypothetical protein T492DRAFT_908807 [Pavlovales sp. CCMP2436]
MAGLRLPPLASGAEEGGKALLAEGPLAVAMPAFRWMLSRAAADAPSRHTKAPAVAADDGWAAIAGSGSKPRPPSKLDHVGGAEASLPPQSVPAQPSNVLLPGLWRDARAAGRCRVAAFCDGDCVRRMWPAHKPCCKEWRDKGGDEQ